MKSCAVLSVARSGTHMIMKLLNMFGLKEFNCYDGRHNFSKLPKEGFYAFGGHLLPEEPYLNQLKDKKKIFITRDPRDIIIATHFHELRSPNSQGVSYIHNKSIDERIIDLIQGNNEFKIPSINNRYRAKLLWRKQEGVYSTKFEKFAEKESRKQEIKNIAKHLEIKLTKEKLKYCVDNLLGSNELYPGFFRKGYIGDWKNYFTEEHKELFKNLAGQLSIEEGYEEDLKW